MCKSIWYCLLFFFFVGTEAINAQFKGDTTWLRIAQPVRFTDDGPVKKFSFGVTFNQSFSTIHDKSSDDYFTKPSIGGGLLVDYAISNLLSLNLGFTHQQHGTGILAKDYVGGIGNGDSTYRTRMRINTWTIPIIMNIKTNKTLFKDCHWSFIGGINLNKVANVKRVFHSVEDGFHDVQKITRSFVPFFIDTNIGTGIEIIVPKSVVLRVHYCISSSLFNVYSGNGIFSSRKGVLGAHGVRFSLKFL